MINTDKTSANALRDFRKTSRQACDKQYSEVREKTYIHCGFVVAAPRHPNSRLKEKNCLPTQ